MARGEIDPVILQLRADVASYQNDVRNTTRLVKSQLGQQEQAITRLERESNRAADSIKVGFRAIAGAVSVGAIVALGKDAVETAIRTKRLGQAMVGAAGSARKAAEELDFARGVADRLGLVNLDTAESYKNLVAAAKGTELAGAGVRDIFESITAKGVQLGLSQEDIEGTLTAVTQIMNKQKVSSEELTQQLGERLPGATAAAAKALGVTTAELFKLLESGELLAEDFLPKLAAELKSDIPASVEAADANFNRLRTTLDDIKTDAADEFIDDLEVAADDLRETLNKMKDDGSLEAIGKGLADIIRFAGESTQFLGRLIQKLDEVNEHPIARGIAAILNAPQEAGEAYNRFGRTGDFRAFGNTAIGADPRSPEGREAFLQAAERERARATSLRGRDVSGTGGAARLAADAERAAKAYEKAVADADRLNSLKAVSDAEKGGIFLNRDPAGDFDVGKFVRNPFPKAEKTETETPELSESEAKKLKSEQEKAARAAAAAAAKAERERLDGIREAARFDEDLLASKSDQLALEERLAVGAGEQAELARQQIDLAQRRYNAGLETDVKTGELTQAQADELAAQEALTFLLQRRIVDVEEQFQRSQDAAEAREIERENAVRLARAGVDLADTQEDRREALFRLMQTEFAIERDRLREQIAAAEAANVSEDIVAGLRKRLANLDIEQTAATETLRRSTATGIDGYVEQVRDLDAALAAVEENGLRAVEDGIVDVISGAESLGDVFKNVANSIISDLIRVAAQQAIVSAFGGPNGGGIGSALAGIFGGGKAVGGPVSPNRVYAVGENGPELFRPAGSGTIIPNHQLAQGGAGGGVSTLRVELSGDLRGEMRDTAAGIAVEVVRAAAPALVSASSASTQRILSRPNLPGGVRGGSG